MRTLITGANGFVGQHLKRELEANGYTVHTTDISGDVDFILNLLDGEQVHAHLKKQRYDSIVHLAGFSSVRLSWENFQKTLELNVFPTINILESVSQTHIGTRVLLIGSSDQYGLAAQAGHPLTEEDPCLPQNPYAISKCTQEQMALVLSVSKKLDIVLTRSFNHIGPGQRKGFVVSDIASSIAETENNSAPKLIVGNTQSHRDFTDVRDVVRAYRLLLEKGRPGEIYNVGSGKVHAIHEVIQMLIKLSGVSIEVISDAKNFRPSDITKIECSCEKLRRDTGWLPEIPMHESLKDTLKWWREQQE